MSSTKYLRQRRQLLTAAWDRYVGTCRDERTRALPPGLRSDIVASWERSADYVAPDVAEAPLADPDDTRTMWQQTPLRAAVDQLSPELREVADEGDLIVAVTDPEVRILWTYGGRTMRRRAERVNFIPGGRWDERSVGTNALDLALRVDDRATVYSAEHFSSCVHGWVCWAAPVHDPATGEQLGVLDLSTTWDRSHPIGPTTAAALARLLEQRIASLSRPNHRSFEQAAAASLGDSPDTCLRLRLLGRAEAWLGGSRLALTRRQLEILALLTLNPEGLSLGTLHSLLYGESAVSVATLKAEVSHLRCALGGRIASRPYRLRLRFRCDVTDVLNRLRRGDVVGAAIAYGGELLPGTDSPALLEHRSYVAVALREALLADPRPEAVLRYSAREPYDVEVLERALVAPGRSENPAVALLAARLSVARRG
jgi:hypothetical protein